MQLDLIPHSSVWVVIFFHAHFCILCLEISTFPRNNSNKLFFHLILDSWILIVFDSCLSYFMSISLYWRQILLSHSSTFLINILICYFYFLHHHVSVLLKVLMVDTQTPRTKGIRNILLAPISCIQMKILVLFLLHLVYMETSFHQWCLTKTSRWRS